MLAFIVKCCVGTVAVLMTFAVLILAVPATIAAVIL